jgi:hypothetical protein
MRIRIRRRDKDYGGEGDAERGTSYNPPVKRKKYLRENGHLRMLPFFE